MKVFITGGHGFLGRAVCARLPEDSYIAPDKSICNLLDEQAINRAVAAYSPDVILHCAAKVGGIGLNRDHPGGLFWSNMQMGMNVLEAARRQHVKHVVLISTTCSYPADCPVPFHETDIWDGYPEETNAAYGIAKRALGMMLYSYSMEFGLGGLCLILANLYGPGDNFRDDSSHAIPALIKRFCRAAENGGQSVTCWGSGTPTRDFLYVEDAADAIVRALDSPELLDLGGLINLGTGVEHSIQFAAEHIAALCDYDGAILWDLSKPDGQRRRVLDTTIARAMLNWTAPTTLEMGLARTVEWYKRHSADQE